MKRLYGVVCGVVFIAANGYLYFACATDIPTPFPCHWAMFRYDAQHTGRTSYAGSLDGILSWSYNTGLDNWKSLATDRYDRTYYCAGAKLYSIDRDGVLLWTYTTGNLMSGYPAIDSGGTIYAGSEDNRLYAINAGGTLRWSYDTTKVIYHNSPTCHGGRIYASVERGGAHSILAFNDSGTVYWSYSGTGNLSASVAIDSQGRLYYGAETQGNVYSLSSQGSFLWSYALDSTLADVSPAIDSLGNVYQTTQEEEYGEDNARIVALTSSGALYWSYQTGAFESYSSPAISSDNSVIFGVREYGMEESDGNLYRLNSNGTLSWSYCMTDNQSSAVIDGDDRIYFARNEYIFSFGSSGTILWSYYVAGAGIDGSSPSIGYSGQVRVPYNDGVLYSF